MKEEKLMKKFVKITVATIVAIALITWSFFALVKEKARIDKVEAQRLEQLTKVADVEEETTFETKSQDEANQLISEIQKYNKRIVKIEFYKDRQNDKTAKAVVKITYSK